MLSSYFKGVQFPQLPSMSGDTMDIDTESGKADSSTSIDCIRGLGEVQGGSSIPLLSSNPWPMSCAVRDGTSQPADGSEGDGGGEGRGMEVEQVGKEWGEEDQDVSGGQRQGQLQEGGGKRPVATRVGGRNRKVSARYEEFKVQQRLEKRIDDLAPSVKSSRFSSRRATARWEGGRHIVVKRQNLNDWPLRVEGGGRGGGREDGIETVAPAMASGLRPAVRSREVAVDTIVLARCRRKSQTMWPARVCSRREVLERLKEAPAGDCGVDVRNECLVVFLCEGGHHVTDWVSPHVIRPYQSRAMSHPKKKKGNMGTIRLQPDFIAAEAWAESLMDLVVSARGEASIAIRNCHEKAASTDTTSLFAETALLQLNTEGEKVGGEENEGIFREDQRTGHDENAVRVETKGVKEDEARVMMGRCAGGDYTDREGEKSLGREVLDEADFHEVEKTFPIQGNDLVEASNGRSVKAIASAGLAGRVAIELSEREQEVSPEHMGSEQGFRSTNHLRISVSQGIDCNGSSMGNCKEVYSGIGGQEGFLQSPSLDGGVGGGGGMKGAAMQGAAMQGLPSESKGLLEGDSAEGKAIFGACEARNGVSLACQHKRPCSMLAPQDVEEVGQRKFQRKQLSSTSKQLCCTNGSEDFGQDKGLVNQLVQCKDGNVARKESPQGGVDRAPHVCGGGQEQAQSRGQDQVQVQTSIQLHDTQATQGNSQADQPQANTYAQTQGRPQDLTLAQSLTPRAIQAHIIDQMYPSHAHFQAKVDQSKAKAPTPIMGQGQVYHQDMGQMQSSETTLATLTTKTTQGYGQAPVHSVHSQDRSQVVQLKTNAHTLAQGQTQAQAMATAQFQPQEATQAHPIATTQFQNQKVTPVQTMAMAQFQTQKATQAHAMLQVRPHLQGQSQVRQPQANFLNHTQTRSQIQTQVTHTPSKARILPIPSQALSIVGQPLANVLTHNVDQVHAKAKVHFTHAQGHPQVGQTQDNTLSHTKGHTNAAPKSQAQNQGAQIPKAHVKDKGHSQVCYSQADNHTQAEGQAQAQSNPLQYGQGKRDIHGSQSQGHHKGQPGGPAQSRSDSQGEKHVSGVIHNGGGVGGSRGGDGCARGPPGMGYRTLAGYPYKFPHSLPPHSPHNISTYNGLVSQQWQQYSHQNSLSVPPAIPSPPNSFPRSFARFGYGPHVGSGVAYGSYFHSGMFMYPSAQNPRPFSHHQISPRGSYLGPSYPLGSGSGCVQPPVGSVVMSQAGGGPHISNETGSSADGSAGGGRKEERGNVWHGSSGSSEKNGGKQVAQFPVNLKGTKGRGAEHECITGSENLVPSTAKEVRVGRGQSAEQGSCSHSRARVESYPHLDTEANLSNSRKDTSCCNLACSAGNICPDLGLEKKKRDECSDGNSTGAITIREEDGVPGEEDRMLGEGKCEGPKVDCAQEQEAPCPSHSVIPEGDQSGSDSMGVSTGVVLLDGEPSERR